MLLGVSPNLMFTIMFIDGFWGTVIHEGEGLLRDGRLGFLNRWLLTPSHHRVHHSRSQFYVDTDYCSLLNIWDRVFGRLQDERDGMPPGWSHTGEHKTASVLRSKVLAPTP